MKKYRYLRKLIYITIAVTYFLVLMLINYFGYLWDSQLQFGMTFLESGKRLVVTKIKSGGIAEKGGIQPKDLLLKVNGEKLSNFQELRKNEKIFWKIKKVELPELLKEIASITNLNQLINKILEKLSLLLNMNSSAFLLSDER